MIGFFFRAQRMLNGRMVVFTVCNGSQAENEKLGEISFSAEEWEAFRPVIIGGMRAASFARVKIEMMDQTRDGVRH